MSILQWPRFFLKQRAWKVYSIVSLAADVVHLLLWCTTAIKLFLCYHLFLWLFVFVCACSMECLTRSYYYIFHDSVLNLHWAFDNYCRIDKLIITYRVFHMATHQTWSNDFHCCHQDQLLKGQTPGACDFWPAGIFSVKSWCAMRHIFANSCRIMDQGGQPSLQFCFVW